MSSPIRATMTPSNSLSSQLEQIGLHALARGVDDFLARATKQRWSPHVGGGEKWGHFGGLEGATCVVAQWTLGRHQKSCIPVWVALRQLWLPLGNRALLPAGRRCSL